MKGRLSLAAFTFALALAAPAAHAFTPQQVEAGRALWNEPVRGKCGQCHFTDGEKGEGVRTPLAGPKALPKKQYWEMAQGYMYWNTAADVADFIVADMPRGRPGTLTQAEGLALTAYILTKNNVQPDGVEMTHAVAEQMNLDKLLPQRATPWALYGGIGGGVIVALIGIVMFMKRRPA